MAPKKPTFATALRTARDARGLSQEALGELSSRTYVSTLERGLKSPTLHKVEQLAAMMDMHPLTLLVMTYATTLSEADVDRALAEVKRELQIIRTTVG
ncbi:helix-turn-helix transcriptional regulator [Paucibacter sp. O1-1]|nr:helix-turn-helix domain-containing protein [Paucibacter sp. O1-1]MDA3831242.1 helix-turn-helix transcriptional regulator [Paucibacter sp. O1-1]